MKKALPRLCALLVSCALLLCGCGNAQAPDENAQPELPDPPPFEDAQILGDVRTPYKKDVSLYYSPENSLDLTAVTRAVHVEQDETLIECTLRELLRTLTVTGTLRSVASAEQLIELEYSCGTACVNLTLEAGAQQSDQEVLLLCAAISDTLLSIEGVQAVNILIGDRSLSVSGLPLGAFNRINDNIPALQAQLQSEGNRYLTEQRLSISRNALLYFPSDDGEFLLPEPCSLNFDSDDYASVILDALKLGPMVRKCCFSAIPGNQELLSGAPKMWISGSGARVIDVNFTQMLPNYLAFAGVEPWQLYGSIVLSLCTFLPELDAVRICVEGVPIDSCTIGEAQLQFPDGRMQRRDFSGHIGSSVQLCFAAPDGSLQSAEHAMSRAAALSPRRLISEMIRVGDPGEGLSSVFPVGIQPEDILGVEVSSGVAVVNLSGGFYSRCQMLDSSAERRLVYAIIHVLTQLDGIRAVRFLVEGMGVDTLAQSIYLRTALLPDPGIVRSNDDAVPES